MENFECAGTNSRERCQLEELSWTYDAWRIRFNELKIEFREASKCGDMDRQWTLLGQLNLFEEILSQMEQDIQETDTSACKNCPRG